jgi:hypothetical protein
MRFAALLLSATPEQHNAIAKPILLKVVSTDNGKMKLLARPVILASRLREERFVNKTQPAR